MELEKSPERVNVVEYEKNSQRCTGVRFLRCGVDQRTSVSPKMRDSGARCNAHELQLIRAIRPDGIPVTLRAIPPDPPDDLPSHQPENVIMCMFVIVNNRAFPPPHLPRVLQYERPLGSPLRRQYLHLDEWPLRQKSPYPHACVLLVLAFVVVSEHTCN